MRETELRQEVRMMRFEDAYVKFKEDRLDQESVARMLGVCPRTFRRYINRYEEEGIFGLYDRRLTQASHRKAPVDETMALLESYGEKYSGWNVNHFYSWYKRDGGLRSYTWVKNTLQCHGAVKRSAKRGAHRRRRDRAPMAGMMLHQDGSTHEWVPCKKWDLIVTMDDATNEHYSMFFVDEEGTASSFRGIMDVILKKGIFCSLYTDRGSHYWNTPYACGKVSKRDLTQFGRAMKHLGIEMIAAYSPQARGRSERAFFTHQGRLPKELAKAGITDMNEANRYLREVYMPTFNSEFIQEPEEKTSTFIPMVGATNIEDILCEQFERVVTADNCVSFERKTLQIPKDEYRCNYIRVRVRLHRYLDGSLAVFHGPRKLAEYHPDGNIKKPQKKEVA